MSDKSKVRTGIRHTWTEEMDDYIRFNWGIVPPREITQYLGIGKTALKRRLKKLGLPSASGWQHKWTPAEQKTLVQLYSNTLTEKIAEQLGLNLSQVYRMAKKLGLRKSDEFLKSDASGRLPKLSDAGAAYRYPKGHVPANKGVKGWQAGGRSAETRFKKGQKCHNWLPIGSTRLSKDGYLQVKMTDTGYPPRDWVAMHNLVWELHFGPIAAGQRVAFKDGKKDHDRISPENLEMVSFAEMMRRNTIHNYGKEIVQVTRLRAVITRKINKRKKSHEQHDQ